MRNPGKIRTQQITGKHIAIKHNKYKAVSTSFSRDSAQLVSDLRDDEHNSMDDCITVKAELLKAKLLEQCIQIRL